MPFVSGSEEHLERGQSTKPVFVFVLVFFPSQNWTALFAADIEWRVCVENTVLFSFWLSALCAALQAELRTSVLRSTLEAADDFSLIAFCRSGCCTKWSFQRSCSEGSSLENQPSSGHRVKKTPSMHWLLYVYAVFFFFVCFLCCAKNKEIDVDHSIFTFLTNWTGVLSELSLDTVVLEEYNRRFNRPFISLEWNAA